MAGDADRDTPSNSSSPSENPFVKFRQFADEHISSLLQGVTGLPSAFSKNPSANTGWTDVDADLRRRDEVQARQNQLRESEARRQNRPSFEDGAQEYDIPVKKWLGRAESHKSPTPVNAPRFDDLPLYSPVKKSLWDHLDQREDNESHWSPSAFIKSIRRGLDPFHWPFPLRQEQKSGDNLKTLQYLIYNDLHVDPELRSDYSMLPYILFSPYSPLKLSMDRSHAKTRQTTDPFPYCAAFEDLIRTTQGRPTHTPDLSFDKYTSGQILPQFSALYGVAWISRLSLTGVLQQRGLRTCHDTIYWPSRFAIPTVQSRWRKQVENCTPVYELDMYEAFHTASPEKQIEALTKAAENSYQDFLKSLESPEVRQPVQAMVDEKIGVMRAGMKVKIDVEEDDDDDDDYDDGDWEETSGKMEETDELSLQDFQMQLMLLEQQNKKRLEMARQEMARQQEDAGSPSSETDGFGSLKVKSTLPSTAQDSDTIISSNTTSDRWIDHEDGTVETTVTVWKKFADGRESTTTTTHKDVFASPHQEQSEGKVEEKASENREKPKQKGWFWN